MTPIHTENLTRSDFDVAIEQMIPNYNPNRIAEKPIYDTETDTYTFTANNYVFQHIKFEHDKKSMFIELVPK